MEQEMRSACRLSQFLRRSCSGRAEMSQPPRSQPKIDNGDSPLNGALAPILWYVNQTLGIGKFGRVSAMRGKQMGWMAYMRIGKGDVSEHPIFPSFWIQVLSSTA